MRPAKDAFADIPVIKIKKEMLDLARHIIETKAGTFDPSSFEDKYEAALVDLVQAKMEGRTIKPPKAPAQGKVVDLMDALRRSADANKAKATAKPVKSRATKTAVKKPAAAKTKTAQAKTSHRKTTQQKASQRKAS